VDGNQNRRGVRRPRRDEEAAERVDPRSRPYSRVRQRPTPGGGNVSIVTPTPSPTGFRTAMNVGVSALAPATQDQLRVIPLGGVGEVGKNMTAVECGNDIVLLDCGAKFPEEDQRGIDLIIPDVSFITERLKRFRGILITHGHEDHIGGLPYIIPMLKEMGTVPIYGTPLALGFIERKLLEVHQEKYVELIPVKSGQKLRLGQMTAEFIHVTHSIPDACAIALHTPVGTIVDTGDFKFDPTPVMGAPTDEKLLKRIGDQGVLALFSDTVRVETEGSTPSESIVQEKMEEVMRKAQGQFIIATFASNVSRIQMALRAAAKVGRKVAVAGRSMEQNARVALDLGYLDPPDGLFVPLDDLLKMPKEKRVIVSTGSQGEAAAALARIAAGEHPKIRVSRGDVIFVSATPIPGNEDTVSHTIDNLFRQGCEVVYSAIDKGVHVSGHAGRDELQKMIKLLRPTYAVPIHGEYRHMALYRELCTRTGISRDHVLLPEIGGVIEFTKTSAHQRGRVPAGNILIDRLGDRRESQVIMRTRDNLLSDGFVLVTMVLDRTSGDLIAGPQLVASGLKPELNNGALHEAEQELRRMLERRKKGAPQYGYMVQRAKETVGKALYRRSRTRPLILPVVTEL
jgi:ribonuclease J